MLLVPEDPLRPRRGDPHFADEAAAARDLGWTVAVVDHDAVCRGRVEDAVARVPRDGGSAVYRGWMLRSEQYADLARGLTGRGVRLRTSPEHYRAAHELPGWYDALAAWTPPSAWVGDTRRSSFDDARSRLDAPSGVLRDFTKSLKHDWDEACHLPDLADAERSWSVAARFAELRGDDLVGGFVLREWEAFDGAEARTWWVQGRCVLVGPHPDDDGDLPGFATGAPHLWLPAGLAEAVAGLALSFVTVDLVARSDGVVRVVELGDGQVSDRPRSLDPTVLVGALGPLG